jgi:predicted ATP-dependent protease
MADLENVIYKLQRALENRIKQLAISVTSGGVDNMETYKYIIGQINALESVKQEISNLLDSKEHYESKGTVIDIKRNGKDTLTK